MKSIRLENISKAFGWIKALDDISLQINEGEILALLGENGSGKTSLMNVIAGIYHPDQGDVFIDDEKVTISSPKDAFKYKIGMIHQHFKLVNVFTAVENIVLGLEKSDYKKFKEEQIKTEEEFFAKLKGVREPSNVEVANAKSRIYHSGKYDLNFARQKVIQICNQYGFKIDPDKHVYDMSVSEKQNLEIVKALFRGVDLLILDEPTAVLTPQEIKVLFKILKNMKADGKTVIIITHKLNEVMEISDRVEVLRKGKYIGGVKTSETNPAQLTEMMVGKKVELEIRRDTPVNPDLRLEINNVTLVKEGVKVLDNVNLQVNGGEILGIAGISGSGQKELLECVAGLQKAKSGDIIFHNPKENKPVTFFHKDLKQIKELAAQGKFHDPDGNKIDLTGLKDKEIRKMVEEEKIIFYENEIMPLNDKTPLEIRNLGIKLSFVPEDRLGMGLVGEMNLTQNMALRSFRKGKGMNVEMKKPERLAEHIVKEFGVVTPNLNTPVGRLSGGNIQKLLVGREISSNPKILMTAYPVRGLDINTSYYIYNLLNDQKNARCAVIYVGEDLDVLLALCDRLAVIYQGKITGVVDPHKVTKEQVGILMTGGSIDA
ncbi:MAG: ABC transporter ATP-binding protein [Bacilli bacterium]|nr:ABC transporter ATP-binding protein [Bacilli bacterium]